MPWIKGNGQREFGEADWPSAKLKRQQYELGKKLLADVGYTEVGMDHFALKTDSLYQSMENGNLHGILWATRPQKHKPWLGWAYRQ